MRTMRTLGLALALALTAVSVSAEAKEQGLSPGSSVVAVHEDSTLAPASVPVAMDIKDVKAETFRSVTLQTRDASDIAPSPEVLEVAHGCTNATGSNSFSIAADMPIETSDGGRNAPVLRAVEAKTYRPNSSKQRSYSVSNGSDSKPGGDRRVAPLSSGVAPQFTFSR